MNEEQGRQEPGLRNPPAWLTATVVVIVAAMLLVPLPQNTRAVAAMLDLLHAPLFAILAFLLARTGAHRTGGPAFRTAVLVWLGLTLLGAAIESAQGLFGRFPSWHDALANALGAGAGVLIALAVRARSKPLTWACSGAAVLLLALAGWVPAATLVDCYRQQRDASLLGSFEHSLELSRWTAHEAEVRPSRDHVTDGEWSLELRLTTGTYPGIESRHLPRDWSGYRELIFDVTLDDGLELPLIVKIYDEPHNMETEDRFHAVVRLTPGRRRVRIPLSEAAQAPRGRRMDLTRIDCLQFFTVTPPQPRTLHFDNIRLQ